MNTVNGLIFKEMLRSGNANLLNHKSEVDALNVFPVPDGDTGTNMSMTFSSGAKDALVCDSEKITDVAKALSRGLLMGARGNSGVITSQIFRGFYQYVDGKDEITTAELAAAFENGARVAYKAIMKPVEGTILTVIREASWYANHYTTENPEITVEEYFARLINYARESLDHTPELLPVLKEVGVVDSGGAGLLFILEGMKAYLDGKPIEAQEVKEESNYNPALDIENDEFGYCTEFIIRLAEEYVNFDENRLKNKLAAIGESLVVVKDDDIVKVHVHTLKPGDALNIGQRYGEFIKLKIENMQEQHSALTAAPKEETKKPQEKKKYAVISVSAGKGLEDLFKELRCDVVIGGGQTMNPSCESFVENINKVNAEHIIILPNNSNIILAANQAKDILSDLDIHVIETKSIQEGIAAISMFNPETDIDTNIEEMNTAKANVQSGSLTYAIKDTMFNGVEVKTGDFIAMTNKTIVASNKDKLTSVFALLDEMFKKEDAELMTVIAGEDATDDEVKKVEEYIENNSDLEVEVIRGDQPVYSFLIGVE